MAIFAMDNVTLSTRLLEGQYPNYQQLIPQQFLTQAAFARREMIAALERISVLAEQKSNIIRMDISQKEITITVDCQEVGSGREVVSCDLEGETIKTAFNIRYLLDALRVMETKRARLSMNSPTSPAIIRPIVGDNEADVALNYLVMPVQLRNI